MDHAEAHERLGDLALEPARLASLDHDRSPEDEALRSHLSDCETCRAELASLRRTDAALRDAIAAAADAGPPPILRAPTGLRARVLAAAQPDAMPGGSPEIATRAAAGARQGARRWLTLALAAALVVAVGLGGVLAQRVTDLERANAELADLSVVVATLDRILANEKHVVVALSTADGTPGGAIAWDRSEVVVVSTFLQRPPEGREYRCWMEEDGKRWPVGTMSFSGSTAYWAGTLESWHASFASGSRFGVSLIPPAGGDPLPVLVANF